jgi:hypothetical protein
MSTFLDQLKTRMDEAHKRLQSAQQKAQLAQAEHTAAAQEFGSLQLLVNLEAQREAKTPIVVKTPQSNEVNKTQLVSDVIRQSPAGLSPSEIWSQLQGQLVRKQYLYSVLKRLKDRDEIVERRGKYVAKIAGRPEGETQQGLVQ